MLGNLHNQFFDNYVVEGNHVFNYNGSYLYPHGKVCWLSLCEYLVVFF